MMFICNKNKDHNKVLRILKRNLFKIAIDGPAASGKSTTSKFLAQKLNFQYIDSGAAYRAVTLAVLRNNVSPDDSDSIVNIALRSDIKLRTIMNYHYKQPQETKFPTTHSKIINEIRNSDNDENNHVEDGLQIPTAPEIFVYLDGEDVTKEIRLPNISKNISSIASNSKVREILVEKFRSLASSPSSSEIKGVVMDGRDVGTVILPDAEIKIFFIADIQVRAKRRYEEILLQSNNTIMSFDQVLNDLERRDKEDFERIISPLRKVKDSIVIHTDNLSVQERVEMIAALAKVRMKN